MKRITALLGLTLLLITAPSFGRDVAGVKFPETVTVQNKKLALSGADVHSKFFMKVYAGALYLPSHKTKTPEAVLALKGPKSVRLHFLKEIAADKLAETWNDGFEANHSEAELKKLKPRIGLFNAMFPQVKSGDVVRLLLLGNGRTEVWVNNAKRGVIAGTDFQKALLKIWLGDEPVDKGLKKAMLGGG